MATHDRRLNTYADMVTGLPVMTSDLQPRSLYSSLVKPALEICVAALILIPASLIIALCAVLIARDGASPFYRQQRIGLNGRAFSMWKLRSMVVNADAVLDSYLDENPDARAEWDRTQKLKDDPRVTRIGKFIRKTSIDELPQLFNVVKGEMALVGPRPMMLDQRVLYPGVAYYAMRPGITGFWQTSARNESSFAERAIFDTSYFSQMSFGTDLRVMVKTIGVVVMGTGY